MLLIPQYPVLVIGAPRTGTTVLSDYLRACNPDIKSWFYEPNKNQHEFQKFLEHAKNNDDYLIKLQGIPLATYPTWFLEKIHSKNIYIIAVHRQNIVNQVTSFYIATVRKRWYYTKDINFVEDNIKIDTTLIDWCMEMTNKENKIVESLTPHASIAYEYIEKNIPNNIGSLKTPRPTNYEELKKVISDKIN